jgi:hypothetical protein
LSTVPNHAADLSWAGGLAIRTFFGSVRSAI